MKIYTARRRNPDNSLRKVQYPIFETEEEFREAYPDAPLTYWKDAEGGYEGFLLDDDGCISECRKVEAFVDGRGYARTKVFFQWSGFYPSKRNHVGFFTTPKRTWSARAVKRRRFRIIIKAMAHMAIRGREPTEEEMRNFGRFFRADQAIPEATLRRLLRTKEAKSMLAKEIADLLDEEGISTREVVRGYERVRELAESRGQLGVAKGILDTYRDMLDMMPEKRIVETSETMELSIDQLYGRAQNQQQIGQGNGLLSDRTDPGSTGEPGTGSGGPEEGFDYPDEGLSQGFGYEDDEEE